MNQLAWIKRRARRLMHAFGAPRAKAVRYAADDWKAFKGAGRRTCEELGVCQACIDHEALTVWLWLVREGGYSAEEEIAARQLNLDLPGVHRALCRLLARDMVRQQLRVGAPAIYGVTTQCASPRGYETVLEQRNPQACIPNQS